jgi:DNA-binding FrmR family transcriptional regulator
VSFDVNAQHHRETIHRIHRLQGQLAALERSIRADDPCEAVVIQARAVEKGVASLITHMIARHLQYQVRGLMQESPEKAAQEVIRLFQLLNR